jgi:dimethylhistidine N-methyltransferase
MQVKQPLFFDIHQKNKDADIQDLIQGLLCPQATLSPKYFYDELGSVLFDAITLLPEYYLTRAELEIFVDKASEIHAQFPKQAAWIDLGAGYCQKAVRLFTHTMPATYVAVDISTEYLSSNLKDLQVKYSEVNVVGLGVDFSSSLALPEKLKEEIATQPLLALYLGSSLGNFNPAEAFYFLQRLANLCKTAQPGSGLIIGIDLAKDSNTLERAYADELGVTAAFNLNVLRRVNSLLSADFDLRDWQHCARFNAEKSRVEMHLNAKRNLVVNFHGHQRLFKKDESIHTENSYKWSIKNFSEQLLKSGFTSVQHWTDSKSHYALFWAR